MYYYYNEKENSFTEQKTLRYWVKKEKCAEL